MIFFLTLVFTTLIHSLSANTVDLEDACGSTLRSRCPQLTRYIVGGRSSCAELAPWNALLEMKPVRKKRQSSSIEVLCGGSLVTNKHIVTAAHCVWSNRGSRGTCREPYISLTAEQCRKKRCPRSCWRVQPRDLNVYLGLTERVFSGPTPRPYGVKSIILHPGWDRLTPLNNITLGMDLAVLELERLVVFTDTTWPICLPNNLDNQLIMQGEELDVFGFGIRDLDTREHAEILQTAHVKLVSRQLCRRLWNITGDQLCAMGVESDDSDRISDSCNGDSGGGVVAQRYDQSFVLVGLVSFGESDCGRAKGRPSVNTNIISLTTWIRNVTGTLDTCTTEDGRSCVFPFKFMGEEYNSCTTAQDPENLPWCSTKTDQYGRHVENAGEWGHCTDACKSDSSSSSEPGSWGSWSTWSPCSRSCGPGKRIRMRECPTENCVGNKITSKTCNQGTCKEPTRWTNWSSWSDCSADCKGSKKRTRSCVKTSVSSSVSLRDGEKGGRITCEENKRESQSASCGQTVCPSRTTPSTRPTTPTTSRGATPSSSTGSGSGPSQQREWSSWSNYSPCSSTCRGGVKRRTRTCVGTRGSCFGSPTDIQQCGTSTCKSPGGLRMSKEALTLIGGWDGQWLPNVTIVDGRRPCPGPNLLIWLADHFSAYTTDSILTCGGRSSDQKTLCWIWELLGDKSWRRAPTMSMGRSYADAVTIGSKVWVTGGWDGNTRHQTSEILDLKNEGKGWQKGQDITASRYQHCGVVLDDGTVVLTGGQGGQGKSGDALSTVEQYDIERGYLRTLPSLQQARWTHGCTSLRVEGREAVMVAGGRVTSGRGDELDSVEILVIGRSKWTSVSPLPQPRLAPGLSNVDDRILLTGGSYEVGNRRNEEFPDEILEYDVVRDRWNMVDSIVGRSHHAALVVPKNLVSC